MQMTVMRRFCCFYVQLLLLVVFSHCDCNRIQTNNDIPYDKQSQTIVYVVSLQNTSHADSRNAGRLDRFLRDWSEICVAQTPLPFLFKLCSGIFDARRGYGLTKAYIKCLDQAIADKVEHPIFFENDARLFDAEFCNTSKRSDLWSHVPADALLVTLGCHQRSFSASPRTHEYVPMDFSIGSYGFMVPRQNLAILRDGYKDNVASRAEVLSPDISWYNHARRHNKRIYSVDPLLIRHIPGYSNTQKSLLLQSISFGGPCDYTFVIISDNNPLQTNLQAKSIRKYYPLVQILVVDFGKTCMHRRYGGRQRTYVDYLFLGPQSGDTDSRRELVWSLVSSDYVVLVDEQATWTESFSIELGIKRLQAAKSSVLSGRVLRQKPLVGHLFADCLSKEKHVCNVDVEQDLKRDTGLPEPCVYTDVVSSVILADRRFLLRAKWPVFSSVKDALQFQFDLKEHSPKKLMMCADMAVETNSNINGSLTGALSNTSFIFHNNFDEKCVKLKVQASIASGRRLVEEQSPRECRPPPVETRVLADIQVGDGNSGRSPVFAVYLDLENLKQYVSDLSYQLFYNNLVKKIGWVVYSQDLPHVDVLLIVNHYSKTLIAMMNRLRASSKVSHFLFWSDDIHWHSYGGYKIKNITFSLPYLNLMVGSPQFSVFYPHINKTPLWVPHSAAPRFQRPLNESAIQKVLLSGATNYWYPFRRHAKDLMTRGNKDIVMVGHPGYSYKVHNNNSFHFDFANHIAQYSAGLTSGLVLNYPVAKHFEIPAVGQLLLTNQDMEPVLKRLCLFPNIHYLSYTKESMPSVIKSAVSRDFYSRNIRIRRAAQRVILKMHTTEARAQLITKIALSLTLNQSAEGFFYDASDAVPILSEAISAKLKNLTVPP